MITQQPTEAMTGESAESTPVPTEEPVIEKPENVVFAENNTARIQMPSDTLTVTFEGKDIKPCNDSVGTLQQAYGDLTGTLNYWTDSGYNIEFYFDNYGTSLTMVSIAYNPEELANLSK